MALLCAAQMLASSNLEHDIQCKYIMIQLHCKDLSWLLCSAACRNMWLQGWGYGVCFCLQCYEIEVLCILNCNFFLFLCLVSVQCTNHCLSRLRGGLFARYNQKRTSNDVILYTASQRWKKRKIGYVSELPESLLPVLGPKDPAKGRGISERVGKEMICLCVWGFWI